jgi:hypothetical protein
MNFLRTVISLCSSFQSYRAIRDISFLSSLKYLAQLMTVLALVLMASFVPWALRLGEQACRWADKNLPPFSIQDGKVVTGVKQPYSAGDSDFLFVLDTTGQVTQPDVNAVQGLLFMGDRVLFWSRSTNAPQEIVQSKQYSLAGFPDGRVDGDYFRRLIRTGVWVGLPIALVITVLVGMLSCLLQSYLFALAASLMERNLPARLQLAQILNIAIHAVTPAAILATAYLAMRIEGPGLWIVYVVPYGIFLVGAATACRERIATRNP